ncbi:MAG: hypothetical protein JSU87_04300 [Gemmatimonadota bacterium]|nr:MAG: hypothetical protein JSU87_04300 [Gemmatimonadota bacterium]
MKKIIVVAAVALMLVLAGEVRAQDWFWGGTYSMTLPLSNTKDFNEGYSFRGVTVEGRKIINENVTAGVTFGWHVLNDERANETVELENGAITGDFFTFTNSFPIMANMHYYLGQRGAIRPYLGASAGTAIVERRAEVGLFALQETNWHFAVAPEVGFFLPAGWYGSGLLLSARWHFMTSAGSAPSQQYVTFNIGFASNN